MSQARGTDPTEWANRRKAAMERAKQIREDRKNALSEGDTFAPQVNARRLSNGSVKAIDSLDQLATQVHPNDPMEQPLAAHRNRDQNPTEKPLPLSPNSDSLGKELKKFGGAPQSQHHSVGQSKADAQYKSQFLRQYEDSKLNKMQSNQQPATQYTDKTADPEDAFASMLRGGGSNARDMGPGWNDDTTSSGFTAPPRKSLGVKEVKKPSRPSAYRNTNSNESIGQEQSDSQPPGNAVKTSPRTTSLMYQARSKLSLLKSKIRQSESAGAQRSSPSEDYSNNNSEYDSGSYGRHTAPYESAPTHSNASKTHHNIPTDRTGRNNHYNHGNDVHQQYDQENNHNVSHSRRGVAEQETYQPTQRKPPRGQNNPPPASYPAEEQEVRHPPASYSRGAFASASPAEEEDEANDPSQPQQQCPDCGRKFNPIPFTKHIKICAKVFQKKRKVFDSAKMRIQDNPELVKILTQVKKEEKKQQRKQQAAGPVGNVGNYHQDNVPRKSNPSKAPISDQPVDSADPKWKMQSNAFREALKAAREFNKAKESGAPLPPPVASAPDPSLVPCPHCGRRFNEKAADRHIPQCKNIIAKPSALRKGGGIAASTGKKR